MKPSFSIMTVVITEMDTIYIIEATQQPLYFLCQMINGLYPLNSNFGISRENYVIINSNISSLIRVQKKKEKKSLRKKFLKVL